MVHAGKTRHVVRLRRTECWGRQATVRAVVSQLKSDRDWTHSIDLLLLLGTYVGLQSDCERCRLRSGLACLMWAPSIRYRLLDLGTAQQGSIQLH